MNIISKNMNFERGQDPKSAMGIGMRKKIKQMMEEDGWYEEYNDESALIWASYYGHINIVEWLLDEKVDLHQSVYDMALNLALENGYMDIAELLKKYM